MPKDAHVAVVAHLYYEEMWPELARCIRQIPPPVDVYVTVPPSSAAGPAIRAAFPRAEIVVADNVGLDVLPFLKLLPVLQRYTAVCKLHSKRDPHWRQMLIAGVAANRDLTKRIVAAFEADPLLGMVGGRRVFVPGPAATYQRTYELVRAAMGEPPRDYGFFAGTMFWVRPAFVAALPERFPAATFAPHTDTDGHPEHAVERAFGIEMTKEGRRVGLVDDDGRISISNGNYSATLLASLSRV
jgi:lipopolysaccharide biosynthesis protein